MQERFLAFLGSLAGPISNRPFLLAVSGGVDSVVLSHLFHLSKLPFAIAHCNFQLRAEESEGDMLFVEQLAAKYQVAFHCKRLATEEIQAGSGKSTQMIARTLRYEWFSELVAEQGYQKIVTAHHLNDSVETVLLNMVRGTGIKGLTGIAASTDTLLRPLLFATKEEIKQFAEREQLTWREDSSNESDKYYRNKVRHYAVAVFEQLNPSFLHTFGDNIQRWKMLANLVENEVLHIDSTFYEAPNWVIPHSFVNNKNKHFVLLEWLKGKGFNETQFHEIITATHVGKTWESENFVVVFDRKKHIVSPKKATQEVSISIAQNTEEIRLPQAKLVLKNSNKPAQFTASKNHVFVDAGKLSYPLTVRNWQQGDKFQPLGLKGKKKVSDFLINEKVPLHQKKEVMVLVSNDQLVWVINYRIDERFKLSDHTSDVLELHYIPDGG